MKDDERTRLWELVELLHGELIRPSPDWTRASAAAGELWRRINREARRAATSGHDAAER